MKYVTLNNGVKMPILGLGTFRSKDEDAYNATLHALKCGYRHIDTAWIYGNEKAVGKAIKDSGLNREDLFITTKLWNTHQGYESALKAMEESLDNLGLDYIDLYLIHWHKSYEKSIESYRALVKLYKDKKTRAIGVSNFNIHHLMNIVDNFDIAPMVNQVETHIELQNHILNDYCTENKIQLEAYAPLMSQDISKLLNNEVMIKIAAKHKKSVPQIAIKWLIERNIVVIPKSINNSRIESNFDVFDFNLSEEDMLEIRKLNKGNKIFPEFDNVEF
ncbi:aldo/keto reductase [Candidatus Izimaplasma bacterium ZiA1]|uniref:aldo/keto reductase n=1 Tax=Candidatus Izimoplasma sp. ZiA1 TaxID=2024899 RepID=UPI000BAA4F1F|nr:aldo/keto reductase [Candidatus Izimaplasma bacterium ZiA1]